MGQTAELLIESIVCVWSRAVQSFTRLTLASQVVVWSCVCFKSQLDPSQSIPVHYFDHCMQKQSFGRLIS